MSDWLDGGVVIGGKKKGRVYRSKSSRRYKKTTIPRNLSKVSKRNLKRNLRTLGEKKYFLTTYAGDATTTGRVDDLTNINQGDGDTDREGDQLGLRSIEINFQTYLDLAAAAPDNNNVVRFIVFQWYPTTTPTVNSILTSLTPPAITPIAPYFHDNRFNFKILLDKRFALAKNGQHVRTFRSYVIKGFKPQVQFNNASITGTNKIYALTISDSGAISHPTAAWVAKLNYSDY